MWKFWEQVLELDMKALYTCPKCGPRPKVLVADGITLGTQIRNLTKCKLPMTVPYNSPEILEGSNHKQRMLITFANQHLIRKACEKNEWPDWKMFKKGDNGAELVKIFIVHMKSKEKNPGSASTRLLLNLSSKTSTTSFFQTVDIPLLNEFEQYLLGDKKRNFCSGLKKICLHARLQEKYPTITNLVKDLSEPTGMLHPDISGVFLGLLKLTLNLYKNSPELTCQNYTKNTRGEVLSQVYPNFPLKYDKARFSNECQKEDERAWQDLCEKTFPEHVQMSPGFFLLTCACSNKTVYGFSFLTKNESPAMLFDIVHTRFPPEYRPTIVYDASCKLKDRHGKSL